MEEKPETTVPYTEPDILSDESPIRSESRIEDVWGGFRTVDAVPTWTPRNFYESIAIYVSGTTKRLYVYDFTNNSWEPFRNTTVNEDGSSALEGAVVLAGTNIDVSQSGQTITFTTKSPFYATVDTSQAFTTVGEPFNVDTVHTCGFTPKLIMMWGRMNDASISTVEVNDTYSTGGAGTRSFAPSVWASEHKIGTVWDSSGTFSDSDTSYLMRHTSSNSGEYLMSVQSTSATGFTVRVAKDIAPAAGDTIYWKYFLIAFP